MNLLPKIIYSLWLQGEAGAPPLVKLCFARWRTLNPDYRLEVLTVADVTRLIEHLPFDARALPPQALSDIVRIQLLARHGGIWVDATVLPIRPLRLWLPKLVAPAGFFAFCAPGVDRLLSSWFIASEPGNAATAAWRREVDIYWSKLRQVSGDPRSGDAVPADVRASLAPELDSYPYFWFHYLFAQALQRSPDAADVWAKVPKLSAIPMHAGQAPLHRPQPDFSEFLRVAEMTALQKLDWRHEVPSQVITLLPKSSLEARVGRVLRRAFGRGSAEAAN